MRIGCLQFAPQPSAVRHNLDRADSMLATTSNEVLDSLDIVIIPELGFCDSSFDSENQATSCLERSGSGLSSLWARTFALDHAAVVIVGYPEKAIRSTGSRALSSQVFNSAILVDGKGSLVGNYRKHTLSSDDIPWACPGMAFHQGSVQGLGKLVLGLSTDINPYQAQTPRHAFEFAHHVLETGTNLVIVSMAWQTSERPESFGCTPEEPDWESLTYWIKRLEPVIRVERSDEILVVFCNRTGVSGNRVFAGTSCVLGIRDGEVTVYGLLGRGEEQVLVADTRKAPLGKLIYRPQGFWPDNPLGIQSCALNRLDVTTGWPYESSFPTPCEPRAVTLRRRLPSLTTDFSRTREVPQSFFCLSSSEGLSGSCSSASDGSAAPRHASGSESDRNALLELLKAIEKSPDIKHEEQRRHITRPLSPKYRNMGGLS